MFRCFSLYFLVVFSLFLQTQCKVRINEVAAHTDTPYYDYVELFNEEPTAMDISGWGLTDSKKDLFKYRFPSGTVIQPGEYRSFDVVKLAGYRLNKMKDKIMLTEKSGTDHDEAKITSSLNHFTYNYWKNSEGKGEYVMNFPTQDLVNRYPIVGPFVITEIGLVGSQQYVKITCIRGTSEIGGTARFTTRKSPPGYELRLREQKEVFDDNDKYTSPAYTISSSLTLKTGESIWIVSRNPEEFYRNNNLPSNRVFGPWKGTLQVTGKGEHLGLYGYEGHPDPTPHFYPADVVQWAPEAPWPIPPAGSSEFIIERVSLTSYSNDPRNWRVKGTKTACTTSSDCPGIDKCTLAYCSAGTCQYTALACNHPNFESCYPDYICKNAGKYGYSTCNIETKIFGHGREDYEMFGTYGSSERMYWKEGCSTIQGSTITTSTTTVPPPPSQKTSFTGKPAEFAEVIISSEDVDLRSTDLEFGNDKGAEQWVYLRVKLDVPASAVISSAAMEFEVDESHSGTISMRIGAEKTTNSASLSKLKGKFGSRGKSSDGRFRSVSWTISDVWSVGSKVKTPDIATVVQQVVSEPGWASGNYMTLIFRPDPSGQSPRRTVKSDVNTITLTVKYKPASSNAVDGESENLSNSEPPVEFLAPFLAVCSLIGILALVTTGFICVRSQHKNLKYESYP